MLQLMLLNLRYLFFKYLPQNNMQRSKATKETDAVTVRQFERYLPLCVWPGKPDIICKLKFTVSFERSAELKVL